MMKSQCSLAFSLKALLSTRSQWSGLNGSCMLGCQRARGPDSFTFFTCIMFHHSLWLGAIKLSACWLFMRNSPPDTKTRMKLDELDFCLQATIPCDFVWCWCPASQSKLIPVLFHQSLGNEKTGDLGYISAYPAHISVSCTFCSVSFYFNPGLEVDGQYCRIHIKMCFASIALSKLALVL